MKPKRALLFVVVAAIAMSSEGQGLNLQQENQVLLQQIAFLQDANSRIADSYQRTLTFLQYFVSLILGGSVIGGFFLVRNALHEIREDVDKQVRDEVTRYIDKSVQGRVEHLERILRREEVVGFTQIDYCRPGGALIPQEYELLVDRGFKAPYFTSEISRIRPDTDIVVLDLNERQLDEGDVEAALDKVVALLSEHTVLVIYTPSAKPYAAIRDLATRLVHFNVANVPVRLVGACFDAAHVAYALRQRQ